MIQDSVEYCSYKGLTLLTVLINISAPLVEYCSYKGLTLKCLVHPFPCFSISLNIVLIKDLNYVYLNKKEVLLPLRRYINYHILTNTLCSYRKTSANKA